KPDAPAVAPIVTYPPQVQKFIDEFSLLNEQEYRDALADAVFQGESAELAAFHSDELIARTLFAAKHLVKETNTRIHARHTRIPEERRAAMIRFRDALGVERARA